MSILIAIGHIVGALISLVAFSMAILGLAEWESERNRKSALQEMSLALSIPVDELDKSENETKVIQFALNRFSSELLRNRLSDLCGWVQSGWGWFGALLQTGIFLGVVWFTITDDLTNSVYAWWLIAVAFFFWISSVFFALICRLLTGRFPGQARLARKKLADTAEQRRSVMMNNDEIGSTNGV
ncbi:MAG: hypothetical protein CVU26_09475 [Betaproteobacteria bacterium HGW-Betaproteobacteria-2]|jgi:hypothetical protein|nr:MAG: hypothetical protein CVU26_09475 [Betaproteobacteria bacterium HGW-Betaproteobacteria-2]